MQNIDKSLEIQLNRAKIDPKWKENAKFLSIKGISKQNCIEKTGEIVAGEPLKKEEKKKIFTFGKYKNKTFDYVRANDENYWNWCCENIKDFNK